MKFENLDEMKSNFKKLGNYGIPYLDGKLQGIFCNELILIGAYPGRGKSTIAEIIFRENDKKSHNVKLFSLENFPSDFYWKAMFEEYKNKSGNYSINYREFMVRKDKMPNEVLSELDIIVRERYKNSSILHRTNGVNIATLESKIQDAVDKGNKIIIIDHLDYIDKDQNENDNDHITHLMSAIRDVQLDNPCAIIAISHLRKQEGRAYIKVPDENEFMGSSNKIKQATTVITFSPNTERDSVEPFTREKYPNRYNTWCKVCKDRYGAANGQTANIIFDAELSAYTYPEGVYKWQDCEDYINSFGKALTTQTKE